MNASVLCVLVFTLVTLGQALPPRRNNVSIRNNPYTAYRGYRGCRGKLMCHDDRGRPICVCASQVCDGHRDCTNGADEYKCTSCFECPAGQFKCPNDNLCIRSNQFCDGTSDCSNGEDEQQCPFECPAGQFKCPNDNLCIRSNQFCDGTPDCPNEEDEQQCPFECPDGQHKCPNEHLCILINQFCDENPDCSDGADEENCSQTVETCCPDTWIPFQGSCYKFMLTSDTFDKTVARCVELNSTLVEINSQEEYDFLNTNMRTVDTYWIGLTDRDVDGEWRLLTTGEVPDFDYTHLWKASEGEPNGDTDENCATMSRSLESELYSVNCERNYEFGLCEKN